MDKGKSIKKVDSGKNLMEDTTKGKGVIEEPVADMNKGKGIIEEPVLYALDVSHAHALAVAKVLLYLGAL